MERTLRGGAEGPPNETPARTAPDDRSGEHQYETRGPPVRRQHYSSYIAVLGRLTKRFSLIETIFLFSADNANFSPAWHTSDLCKNGSKTTSPDAAARRAPPDKERPCPEMVRQRRCDIVRSHDPDVKTSTTRARGSWRRAGVDVFRRHGSSFIGGGERFHEQFRTHQFLELLVREK